MHERTIVIIDYGLGNLGSMLNMMKKIGANAVVTSDHKAIAQADKLILPGVGSFDAGMKNLAERDIIRLLNERVLENHVPILGVCLGMQLMGRKSEEGILPGLGWLDAVTSRFRFEGPICSLNIPHMGWNQTTVCKKHPLFEDLVAENRFYFVHSYHLHCADEDNILAQTNYGVDFTSAVAKDNILGVQFHPEKSHKFGMRLLQNFAERV